MFSQKSFSREIVRRLPNAAILGLLAVLGGWGHLHHWQLPRFWAHTAQPAGTPESGGAVKGPVTSGSEQASSTSSNVVGETEGSESAANALSGAEPSNPEGEDNLPIIGFRSEAAVGRAQIHIDTAETIQLDEFIVAHGVVGYDETRLAQLAARTPGIAWRVDKGVGDVVGKGEVLAILDSSEVGKAKAELLEATVNFELKSSTLRRLEKIRTSIPERTIREAEADEKLAHVRQFNAQQMLLNLGLPLPASWNEDLTVEQRAKKIQFLGLPESIVAGFGAEVITANLIPLTAPFGGVIIEREVVTGEVVQTGRPEFVIADVSRMWLKLNVRKADAGRLAIGQEIWFSADGDPREVKSRLAWIATEVDEKTRTVQVRGEAENPRLEAAAGDQEGQRLLRAHTFGTARIRVRDRHRAVVVPNSAIQSDGERHLVFVPLADGRRFQPRVVALGITHEDVTEIVRGIRAGQRIVTSGSYVLKAELGREQTSPPSH